jgi:hypothetical protein
MAMDMGSSTVMKIQRIDQWVCACSWMIDWLASMMEGMMENLIENELSPKNTPT